MMGSAMSIFGSLLGNYLSPQPHPLKVNTVKIFLLLPGQGKI